MSTLALILTLIVAALHIGFLVLEMFLWDTPKGRKIFNLTPEFSKASAALAANQGLYNGFLAAGLFWGVFAGKSDVTLFFLVCVLIAGIYGGMTVSKSILRVQAAPAFLALIATLVS